MLNPMRSREPLLRAAFVLPLSLMLACGFSGRSYAQAISGDIVGVVTDQSGAVVPNEKVQVTNLATGVTFSVITKANGEYRFTNLQVGHYSIQASGSGLAGGYKDVEVVLSQTVTANIPTAPEANASSVEVTSTAVAIDTTTAQIQTTFGEKQSEDLPTTSRGNGVVNLSLLNAGAASSGGVGEGTGPSLSGLRPTANNYTIEGVDNNNKTVPAPVVNVPNDAVQNFTVLQNQFSPEFGHSSGGQFNTVIVSGTNAFHGRAFEYFQNRNLNAVSSQQKLSKVTQIPRYDNNRFGGQVGGPIFKDKLFFFGNAQYNPVGSVGSTTHPCAPTAAGYTTLSAIPGASAANIALFKQYIGVAAAQGGTGQACPAMSSETVPFAVGQVNFAGPNFTNDFETVDGVDYNISAKDQLRLRYIYNKTTATNTGAANPVFWTPSPTKQHLFALGEYHTFTPMVLNEFRLGFNRSANVTVNSTVAFPFAAGFPNINIEDLNDQIGPGGPSAYVQNLYQATDNLTWTKGKHTFTFGGEARKYISPANNPVRLYGDYEWNTLYAFALDTRPDYFGERSEGDNPYYGDQTAFYGYGNDEFRMNPHLTFNVGLRYEFTSVPVGERQQALNAASSVSGLITFAAPQPQYKNFSPRLGFAYSPGSAATTSIRGGFGVATDVIFDNLGRAYRPPQLSPLCDVTISVQTASCHFSTTAFLANGGLPGNNGAGYLTYATPTAARNATGYFLPQNAVLPYSENYNLGIQHVFARKYTLEVRYVGTRGLHLVVQNLINRVSPVTATTNLPTYTTAPGQATLNAAPLTLAQLQTTGLNVVPAFYAAGFVNSLTSLEPYGASNYNGLQTQFSKTYDHGLQFLAAWTYSHALDDSTADVSSTTLTPRRPQDDQNLHADYSSSDLDHRHRVTAEVVYDVPFFKTSRHWIEKNLIGNLEIAPIYTFQAGSPYTPQSGVDSNLNGDSAPDRTIINPNGVRKTGTGAVPLVNATACPAGTTTRAANMLPGTTGLACSANTVGYATGYQVGSGAATTFVSVTNAQYIQAGLGAYANASRNTLLLPYTNNFDFTAVKRFNVWGERQLEFQAQAFNVFNHSQYIAGSLNAVDSVGTFTTAETNFVRPSNAAFNNPKLAFSNNPRSMLLVAKFIF
jgi:hypothetical protein